MESRRLLRKLGGTSVSDAFFNALAAGTSFDQTLQLHIAC